jgi:3-polyprenyl-4-hydroxybenzoate decarboxylase
MGRLSGSLDKLENEQSAGDSLVRTKIEFLLIVQGERLLLDSLPLLRCHPADEA